tara:strand:- start:256 stop:393 length:138 start_codon:yes stop_codon:yes gene_type:complete
MLAVGKEADDQIKARDENEHALQLVYDQPRFVRNMLIGLIMGGAT